MSNSIRTVSILGAGNVAFHLARALVQNTVQVKQIFNRTLEHAEEIGEANKISFTDQISELEHADLFIIAASDSVISELSMNIPFDDTMVVHTSGSIPMNALKGNYDKGVFYPLQTFSKGRYLEYDNIPIFIESDSEDNAHRLKELGKRISIQCMEINSEQRAKLHLAAVWACNFVNHMYYMGEKTVKDAGINFDYLKPLINETASKLEFLSPYDAQTGPAMRKDQVVIEKHLELIKDDFTSALYEKINQSINQTYQDEL